MKLKAIITIVLIMLAFFSTNAQNKSVTLSGLVKDKNSKTPIPYANAILKNAADSKTASGTVTAEDGRFNFTGISTGNYLLEISAMGYQLKTQKVFVGSLSDFLDLNTIEIEEDINTLNEVVVTSKTSEVSSKMDKKVFSLADNIAQSGGSVLQSMQSLPGVTLNEGKIQLRGNDKVMVLTENKLLLLVLAISPV